MGRTSGKLLKGRKYGTLKTRLADRLGADEAAPLWARAERCQLFCRNDEVCYGELDGIRFVRTGGRPRGQARADRRMRAGARAGA